jgi:hypothetical protein
MVSNNVKRAEEIISDINNKHNSNIPIIKQIETMIKMIDSIQGGSHYSTQICTTSGYNIDTGEGDIVHSDLLIDFMEKIIENS